MNKKAKQYLNLIVGSILLSLGIYLFVTPNNINFGGVIGLSQIIDYFLIKFFHITSKVGIINFLINMPLFIMAFELMSNEFCIKTLLSLAIQTVILSLLPPLSAPLVDDILLNCLFGAMMCGIGVGIALRSSGCCGGIDIACMCIVKRHPGFKTGQLSIYINAALFSICFFIFDLKTTMYSIVFVALLYTMADKFHDQNINVAALIFTDQDDIKEIIMKQMGRGVTFWNGYGAYTGSEKEILFCAVNKYEVSEITNIVTHHDPKAFITFFEGPMIKGGFEKRL